MISHLLEARSVSIARYRSEVGTLHSLSLSVKSQETVCVFGTPGSGIHRIPPLLFGLHRPISGVIRYMGIEGLDPERRRLIRFLPARDPCAPIFQVSEYLQWVSLLHRVPFSRARTRALLATLGLTRRKRWLIRRLPPDEIGLLRWGSHLAGNPLLIVSQNPSTWVSPKSQGILLEWLREVRDRGGGLLFLNDQISDLSVEMKLDPVCYFLYGGRVVLEGSLQELNKPFRMVTFEAEDISASDVRHIAAWSVREGDFRVIVQTDLPSRESVRKALLEAQGRIVIEEVTEKPLSQWLGF